MSLRLAGLLIVAFLSMAGCGDEHAIRSRIDRDWHRQTLEQDHLARWLKVLPTDSGFFNTAVARDWRALDAQPGDLVGQSRGIFVMAAGHALTGNPAYAAHVRQGADFMLARFRDPLHGGWFEAVNPDGSMRNDNKRLYSQAFAIFALAHAYRATGEPGYLDAALQTWQEIRMHFADGKGGFRAGMNRDFSRAMLDNSQNPLMHLFEALLELHQASGAQEAREGAESIGRFIAYQLLEGLPDGSARIPELYDADWKPLPDARGGRIDIGHQFEWAFLFSIAAEAGLNPVYAGVADRLLSYAVANGLPAGEQGAIAALSSDGKANRQRGYWQQAEALRALMHHATSRGRDDLWGYVTQLTDYIRSEFLDPKHGGWYSAPRSSCEKTGCTDRQPDGYHMTAMHLEAIRLTGKSRR
jgi:mannose-6-phosphate isomerase